MSNSVFVYIQPDIMAKARKAMPGRDDNAVTSEIMRQATRLMVAYKEHDTKHSLYWNMADRCALYTLAHNQQLVSEQVSEAVRDLRRVELMQRRMHAPELRAYDNFLYFVETISARALKTEEHMCEAVNTFVADWRPDERLVLRGMLRLAFEDLEPSSTYNKRLARSMQDAVSRVRLSGSGKRAKETLRNRALYAIGELAKGVVGAQQQLPIEEKNTAVTMKEATAAAKNSVSADQVAAAIGDISISAPTATCDADPVARTV